MARLPSHTAARFSSRTLGHPQFGLLAPALAGLIRPHKIQGAGLAGLCGNRFFVQRTAKFDHTLRGGKYDSRGLRREFRSGDLSVRCGADGFTADWWLDSRCGWVIYAGVFAICDNQCDRVDRHTASAPKCTVGLTFT